MRCLQIKCCMIALLLMALTPAFAKALSILANPFQYDGEYQDAGTPLLYLKARYLNQSTPVAYFITHDYGEAREQKALFDGDYNAFAGNPIMNEDPSGHGNLNSTVVEEAWDKIITNTEDGEFADMPALEIINVIDDNLYILPDTPRLTDFTNYIDTNRDMNKVYDPRGFDQDGIHRDTSTRFNLLGFDQTGRHRFTNTPYNVYGFNWDGIHRDTNGTYDLHGFDSNGIHRDTETSYDLLNFNRDNINQFTQLSFDSYGFRRNGVHAFTQDIYDLRGFDRNGINRDTQEHYGPQGFDRDGIHRDTNDLYDPRGFNKYGCHRFTGQRWDLRGYDSNGRYVGRRPSAFDQQDDQHRDSSNYD